MSDAARLPFITDDIIYRVARIKIRSFARNLAFDPEALVAIAEEVFPDYDHGTHVVAAVRLKQALWQARITHDGDGM